MLQELLQKDTELFLFLNSLGVPSWDAFWLFMTEAKTWITLYVVFLLLIFLKERNVLKTLLILALLVALVGLNDGFSNFAKHFFERLRPCRTEEVISSSLFRMVAPYCGKYGYFSAHAANHFAMAVFLGIYFKPVWRFSLLILLVWASVIAYSRIYIGVHYPLDILTGAFVGSVLGCFFIKYLYPFIFRLFWRRKPR